LRGESLIVTGRRLWEKQSETHRTWTPEKKSRHHEPQQAERPSRDRRGKKKGAKVLKKERKGHLTIPSAQKLETGACGKRIPQGGERHLIERTMCES